MEAPEIPTTESSDASALMLLRRVRRNSIGAYVAFAVFALISSGFHAFLGLTCSAAVTIISFLWLEEIVDSTLQPSPQLAAWRLILRTVGRFTSLVVAISVTIVVLRFDAVSVLMGFSVVVVGIICEAVYSTYKSFAS